MNGILSICKKTLLPSGLAITGSALFYSFLFVSMETLSKKLQHEQEKQEKQAEQAGQLPPLISNLYESVIQTCGTVSIKTIDNLCEEGNLYIQNHPHRLFISTKSVFSALTSSTISYIFTLPQSLLDSHFSTNTSQPFLYLVYVLIVFSLMLSCGYLVQIFVDPLYNSSYYRAQQLRMDLVDLKIKLLAKDAPQAVFTRFEWQYKLIR